MRRDHPLLPYAATLAGVGVLSLMDALMKGAALAVGAYSALLLRSVIGLALVAPVCRMTHTTMPTPAVCRLHILRGVVMTAMAFTFFWGIARLPLAEALALAFVAPLIALYLAAALLGETIRRRAIGASLMGLVGVAVIAAERLGKSTSDTEAGWGIATVLISSALYAWNLVLQRQQALLARPAEVALWQNGVIGIVLLLFAPFLFEWPAPTAWLGIAGASVLSLTAAMLFAWAYARAEAQALVPLEYSGFLWAALFGWLFFAEKLSWTVLSGAALIVIACWIAAPRKRLETTVV